MPERIGVAQQSGVSIVSDHVAITSQISVDNHESERNPAADSATVSRPTTERDRRYPRCQDLPVRANATADGEDGRHGWRVRH